jgi:predicted O-methyltransferase YrrM
MTRSPFGPATTAEIARLVATVPGWTPEDQLLGLSILATATAPLGGDVLEIGSWCGRSTAVLGHAVRRSGIGIVHAVDLFPARTDWTVNPDGSHSFIVRDGDLFASAYMDQTVWDEPFQRDIAPIYLRHETILDAFQETITREGLRDVVHPFRGTGTRFAAAAPTDLRLRLAFLDGDHGYEAVCGDIAVVERFLLPGGWIAFDDAFSHYDGVDQAIRERILGSGRYDLAQQISRKLFVARWIGQPT